MSFSSPMLHGVVSNAVSVPLLLALLVAAPLGNAASTPLNFSESLQLAVTRSRQVAAQDAAFTAASQLAVSAGQLPDPTLRLGIDNLPVDGPDRFNLTRDFMTMRRIGLMQEITREEKRRLRSERGAQEVEREGENRRATLVNVQRDAAMAWLARYYSEQMRGVIVGLRAETRASIEAAETAYRGGRGGQSDVLAARTALVMLEDRVSVLDRQVRAASIALARWLGADAERPLAAPPDLRSVRLNIARLDNELLRDPQLAVALKQAQLAQTDVRLARAAKRPDWSVEIAYSQRGPAYSNMLSIGISVPLQIAPGVRQDRELGAKLAMAEQSQAQYEDAVRMRRAEVQAMVAEWESGLERLARIETSLASLAAQQSQAALAAYRGNAATLTSVLEARRNESEIRLQALELTAETARAWAQLNFLLPDHSMPNGEDAGRTLK